MRDNGDKLALALCGVGRFAIKRILPAIAMCQNVKLVAIIDPLEKENCLPAGIRRFESLDNYLDYKPTGAVYIATPNYLHARHSIQSLTAGLHVLCEKPMATNSHDCQLMVKAAQNQKLYLKIGHMLRHSPALQLARQWLQSGLIGKPRAISAFFNYDLPEINRPWAFDQKFAGGGALMDAGIHCIDAIRFLMGDPVVAIGALTDRSIQENSVERSAVCSFTAGGVISFTQVCSQAPYWTRLSISGMDGIIVLDNFAACWGKVTVKIHGHCSGQAVKEEIVDVSMVYSEQIRDFANKVERSEFSIRESLDAAKNIKIVEELYAINKIL